MSFSSVHYLRIVVIRGFRTLKSEDGKEHQKGGVDTFYDNLGVHGEYK